MKRVSMSFYVVVLWAILTACEVAIICFYSSWPEASMLVTLGGVKTLACMYGLTTIRVN